MTGVFIAHTHNPTSAVRLEEAARESVARLVSLPHAGPILAAEHWMHVWCRAQARSVQCCGQCGGQWKGTDTAARSTKVAGVGVEAAKRGVSTKQSKRYHRTRVRSLSAGEPHLCSRRGRAQLQRQHEGACRGTLKRAASRGHHIHVTLHYCPGASSLEVVPDVNVTEGTGVAVGGVHRGTLGCAHRGQQGSGRWRGGAHSGRYMANGHGGPWGVHEEQQGHCTVRGNGWGAHKEQQGGSAKTVCAPRTAGAVGIETAGADSRTGIRPPPSTEMVDTASPPTGADGAVVLGAQGAQGSTEKPLQHALLQATRPQPSPSPPPCGAGRTSGDMVPVS
ncbi:hypothetical protein DFH07DRAFT_768370 [Mycena maculata]|uniref:Uncharacterized protein n=1 Tax=Mycena maculata TaxID=230809 RepID=A0AAD7JXC6_9AGAR|nr:hypothetical protein DFH07DRAFT_768370 [Mycena maculata]